MRSKRGFSAANASATTTTSLLHCAALAHRARHSWAVSASASAPSGTYGLDSRNFSAIAANVRLVTMGPLPPSGSLGTRPIAAVCPFACARVRVDRTRAIGGGDLRKLVWCGSRKCARMLREKILRPAARAGTVGGWLAWCGGRDAGRARDLFTRACTHLMAGHRGETRAARIAVWLSHFSAKQKRSVLRAACLVGLFEDLSDCGRSAVHRLR